MIEAMVAVVVAVASAALTYLAKEVDPLFGWALVSIYGLLIGTALVAVAKAK